MYVGMYVGTVVVIYDQDVDESIEGSGNFFVQFSSAAVVGLKLNNCQLRSDTEITVGIWLTVSAI